MPAKGQLDDSKFSKRRFSDGALGKWWLWNQCFRYRKSGIYLFSKATIERISENIVQNQETDQLEIYKNLLLQAAKISPATTRKTFFRYSHSALMKIQLQSYLVSLTLRMSMAWVQYSLDGLTDAINTFNPIAEADDYGSRKSCYWSTNSFRKSYWFTDWSDTAIFLIGV